MDADNLHRVLSNCSQEKVEQLQSHLQDLGVQKCEDLCLVTENDLTPVINVIEARKLILSWKKGI